MRIGPIPPAVLVACTLCGGMLSDAVAQGPADPQDTRQQSMEGRVDDALKALATMIPEARVAAFYQLVDVPLDRESQKGEPLTIAVKIRQLLAVLPSRDEAVRQALLQLATIESKRMREARFSEDWSNYLAHVFEALGALRDVRAAGVLTANLDLGNIVTSSAASLGAPVIPYLLPRLQAGNAPVRNGAARTLNQLVTGPAAQGLSSVDRENIKQALFAATGDENRFVRMSVVDALSAMTGDDVTNVLRRIAESDPYVIESSAGASRYPIREQALRHLAARKLQRAGSVPTNR